MTFGAFRDTLFGPFINDLSITTAQLSAFINLAKIRLQRKFDLKVSVVQGGFVYTMGGTPLPANFKSFFGEWAITFIGTTGLVVPLRGSTFETEQRRLRSNPNPFPPAPANQQDANAMVYYIIPNNTGQFQLFLKPDIGTASLTISYYSWLADYVVDSEEDWLLIQGRDALLWESCKVANTFLDEDKRIVVNDAMFNAAIAELIDYNDRVIHSGAEIDVD